MTLGIDIGSSSIKLSLLDTDTGRMVGAVQLPEGQELTMQAPQPGWAEQDPERWWTLVRQGCQQLMAKHKNTQGGVRAVGISYQMHGLVLIDEAGEVLRPSIIWCDSRAVAIGEAAFAALGADYCLPHLLNSPGNFTAAKLRWVQENEPALYARIHRAFLPGDFIAYRLTGTAATTDSGLSEGTFYDFQTGRPAARLLDHWQLDARLLADRVPTFGKQGRVSQAAAAATGLPVGIPVSYRAGDQPNNALSLNVLNAGEVATTAGTSGVVYGVSDKIEYDPKSRVNSFAHVNHRPADPRIGILLCVNGTGILNSWIKRQFGAVDYPSMNAAAAEVPIGSDGLTVLPFGNGAERVLENRRIGAAIHGLDFNRHRREHLYRAAQEGIAFALAYGFELMRDLGLHARVVRAGRANLFLSPVFREAFVQSTGSPVELYATDGAQGAARGAAIGAGIYASAGEAFGGLRCLATISPDGGKAAAYGEAFGRWKERLVNALDD